MSQQNDHGFERFISIQGHILFGLNDSLKSMPLPGSHAVKKESTDAPNKVTSRSWSHSSSLQLYSLPLNTSCQSGEYRRTLREGS
jgi:hypothetical protein